MLIKDILYFGRPCKLVCDGRCDKAWGVNGGRPAVFFDHTGQIIAHDLADAAITDPDDYAYFADDEVGTAPEDPGTYEGGHAKPSGTPLTDAKYMNKWCARECERSALVKQGEAIKLPDFSVRLYNKPDTAERVRKLNQ